jgi:hypothetical protein
MEPSITKLMEVIRKKYPARTFVESYIKRCKNTYKNLTKDFPILWKYVFSKRYILPNYRQPDYSSQEACDYLLIDSFFAYLMRDISLNDHVSAHCINNFVAAMNYNRPTFYLERELGEPLVRTKLPLDYYASDINWRFPAFRVYLPSNLLTITREGEPSGAMFLDIAYVPKHKQMPLPKGISEEINASFPSSGQIPMLNSNYEGMAVTTFLDFNSPYGLIGYAASTMLEQQSIRNLMEQMHDELDSPVKSDELDIDFQYKILALAINILLFLSSVPSEYEPKELEVIRKPRLEGKSIMSGLYPARFVGQSQLRPTNKPSHIASASTGKHLAAHWAAGHWKRQPYGPKLAERKLIWISPYHTGGQ